MKKIYFFAFVLVITWGTLIFGGDRHYLGDTYECSTCHQLHASTVGPLLKTPPDVPGSASMTNYCFSCHNGTVAKTDSTDLKIHQPSATRIPVFNFANISCTTCHNPHRKPTLPNIKNIRRTIEYSDGTYGFAGKRTVKFESRNDYALGNENQAKPNRTPGVYGICEVCHTKTRKYQSNGDEFTTPPSLEQHYTITWRGTGGNGWGTVPACVGCHRHNNSFQVDTPTNGNKASEKHCVDCHSSAILAGPDIIQERREVVSEFYQQGDPPKPGSHFTLATDADPTDNFLRRRIKQSRQCIVCHDMLKHRQGKVRLKDPDNDSNVTSFTQMTIGNRSELDGRSAAEKTLQDTVMNNFCVKCHDSDASRGAGLAGASDPDNYKLTSSTATATTPFNTGTLADVYGQFATTNNAYHPVRGYKNNTYVNANTLTATYWSLKNANPRKNINCWDCHELNGHGGNFSDMTIVQTWSDNPNSGSFASAQATFCTRCHKSTVYYVNGGGADNVSRFNVNGLGSDSHGVHFQKPGGGGGNDFECRNCHAGLVNKTSLGANAPTTSPSANPYKGNIHGYSFTWPAGSHSSGLSPQTFMLGGYLEGWQYLAPGNNGTIDVGRCYSEQCNHNGQWAYYNTGGGT